MAEVITLKRTTQHKTSPETITEIRLLKLRLENFKGVKNFELHSSGGDISIWGDNAAGKTTLADAFSWLLFNKDSQSRADFDIKTLDSSGRAHQGLDHAVEAVLSLRGKKLELRKVYKEKWVKKRGSVEREFSGHTRDHFIDGVPVNQSDYEAQVAELITTEEVSKLLTNPLHFAERLHWQERRQKLLEICGDVSDDDVIASSRDLSDLTDILDGKSLDDFRKVAQARKRKINGELQLVPARIDEVTRSLPELQAVDLDELGKQILKLRAERNAAEEARARIKGGGEIAERTKQLREIEATLIEEQNEARAKANVEADKKRRELSGAKDELDTAVRQNGQIENFIANAEADVQAFEKRMDELRKKWNEINKEKFIQMEGDDVCAACGQNLPPDQIEEARAKALTAFNEDRASRLSFINSDGKKLLKIRDDLNIDTEKQREKLAKGEVLVAELRARVEELQTSELESDKDTPSDFRGELAQELQQQKQEIEAEIESLKSGNADALAEVEKEIVEFDARIAEVETKLSRIEQRRSSEKRIGELRSQERLLASEYEELERGLYLCEEFTRRKVSMLTERINGRFELARFKLFDIQVNGAMADACDVAFDGVPWPSLNTGAQINIGLDIIRTLSEHHGIAPPIFVDHSESVTKLLDTPGQQIRLIVSENHKSLHVEEVER